MSDEFTLTIDGREATAEPGMTVMQAADRAGIRIPRLCYHPQLEPFAGCRLCLVEVEGMRALAASCALPAAPRMVVRTDTERVAAARRLAVELLLSGARVIPRRLLDSGYQFHDPQLEAALRRLLG